MLVTMDENGNLVEGHPACGVKDADGKECGCKAVWGISNDLWVCFRHSPEASDFKFKCDCEKTESVDKR